MATWPVLQADDDQLCLVGPGDEVRIEFQADGPAAFAGGLDAQLCAPRFRLLQGRRPVHGHQRHRRAAALARNAGLSVRSPMSNGQATRLTNRTCAVYQTRPAGGGD